MARSSIGWQEVHAGSAAVELHRTLGPAKTTVTEVARRARVSRMTVYNHFPTEVDLFVACSTHWASLNPFPDPSSWAAIDDPSERLRHALAKLYEWYGDKEDMLGKVFRDTPIVPALETVMADLWSTYVEVLVETLARGWPTPRGESKTLEATLRLAVDFGTWRVLTESGLDHGQAAEFVARVVIGAT